MAVTEAFSGSEAVTTTEWSLVTDTSGPDTSTAAGEYQCFIDLSAMLLGDTFEFRVSEKVTSGGTQRVCFLATFNNAQGTDSANWVSPKFMLLNGWDMTLLKTAGTDRTITWSIRVNDSLSAAGIRTAVGLASANLDTQLTAIDDFIDTEVAAIKAKTDLIPGTQDGKTFAESIMLFGAVLLGKASGLATTTAVYRSVDDGEDRVTATVDANGNRSAVTLNTA